MYLWNKDDFELIILRNSRCSRSSEKTVGITFCKEDSNYRGTSIYKGVSLSAQEESKIVSCYSHVGLLWPHELYISHQAPLSMGFSRQEYWSGWLCPPPRDLPDPGIESRSPTLLAYSLPSELLTVAYAGKGQL